MEIFWFMTFPTKLWFVQNPLPIMFDKVDGVIRDYGRTKSSSHNYAKIKIDPDDDLPLGETLSLQDVVMFIKSVFYKNHNQYYNKTF